MRLSCITRPILILLVLTCNATPTADDFEQALFKFAMNMDRFVRAYEGCPDAPIEFEPGDCKKVLKGKLDQKLYRDLREQAKKLFDLEEKK
jgi:hypothetical protein